MDEKKEEKKVRQAIALEYNPSEDAPRVIASGRGILAEKIIEKAKESQVPVHRDDKLADTLSRLDRKRTRLNSSHITRSRMTSYE